MPTATTSTGRGGCARRGEREPARGSTILDVVMIVSVAVALIALAVWFFVFAGSSLPPR